MDARGPQLAHLRVFQSGWTSDEEYGDFCRFQCHHSGRDAHAWVKQMPRLEEIHANLADRLQEAKDQGWLGEVAAIETTLAAATET